ncbi:MAG: SBBP repeat-containing protein [Candidatus Hodarchaeota archaeon]
MDTIHKTFLRNKGQLPDYLAYYAIFPQGSVGFGCSTIYFILNNLFFQLAFLDAYPVEPIGTGELQGHSNYFIGESTFCDIDHFSYIKYENLYDGITLRYKLTSEGLKYEFLVDPYADTKQIKMAYIGIDDIIVNPSRVELRISDYFFVDDGLVAWYDDNKQKISCSFTQVYYPYHNQSMNPVVEFTLAPNFDNSRSIIIDPLLLAYSTYLGGNFDDIGNDIVLDSFDNIYITGFTQSTNFPVANPYNSTKNGNRDVFIIKLSSDGSSLIFSTFIGGYEFDTGNSIELDSSGNIFVTGATKSSDFPTLSAYDSTHGGFADAFLLKLTMNGSLVYSTFIGGSTFDSADSLTLDSSGNVYITGNTNSIDFPVVNAYDSSRNGGSDAFIAKLSNNGSLLYSTYIGGSRDETLEFMISHMSIALDSANNIYITGTTWSQDFPTISAYDPSLNGGWDVFLIILSEDGSTILSSSYFGGSFDDFGNDIVIDSSNNIYIIGTTNSEDFPVKNAYDSSLDGEWDAFIIKLSAIGSSIIYSTFIGGNHDDYGNSLVLENSNDIYMTGETKSVDFPIINAYDSTFNGESDSFFLKMSNDGSTLDCSTFIGGSDFDIGSSITLDSSNNIFITGNTKSNDLPMKNAIDSVFNSFYDTFLVKIEIKQTINTDNGNKMKPNIIFGVLLLFGISIILLSVIFYQKH